MEEEEGEKPVVYEQTSSFWGKKGKESHAVTVSRHLTPTTAVQQGGNTKKVEDDFAANGSSQGHNLASAVFLVPTSPPTFLEIRRGATDCGRGIVHVV